ncbi:hypothetical protein J3F83DRAFT_314537 [Trichoderma novae-zelandiae]
MASYIIVWVCFPPYYRWSALLGTIPSNMPFGRKGDQPLLTLGFLKYRAVLASSQHRQHDPTPTKTGQHNAADSHRPMLESNTPSILAGYGAHSTARASMQKSSVCWGYRCDPYSTICENTASLVCLMFGLNNAANDESKTKLDEHKLAGASKAGCSLLAPQPADRPHQALTTAAYTDGCANQKSESSSIGGPSSQLIVVCIFTTCMQTEMLISLAAAPCGDSWQSAIGTLTHLRVT